MEDNPDPLPFLKWALGQYKIQIEAENDHHLTLARGYEIEVEGPSLFKLSHLSQVVGPFASVEELCEFIVQDIQLNDNLK